MAGLRHGAGVEHAAVARRHGASSWSDDGLRPGRRCARGALLRLLLLRLRLRLRLLRLLWLLLIPPRRWALQVAP